jgi:predicted transcriptional regulator
VSNVLDLRSRKFVQVTKSVLKDEVILDKPAQKLVYTMLCMYADNQTKNSYPSIKTLATKCCCSESTVRYALKKLREVGLIEIQYRKKSNKDNETNVYVLLDPPGTFEE